MYYVKKGAAAAAKLAGDVGAAINPMDSNNLANQAANAIGGVLVNNTTASGGQRPFSLGTWLYEATHPATPPTP